MRGRRASLDAPLTNQCFVAAASGFWTTNHPSEVRLSIFVAHLTKCFLSSAHCNSERCLRARDAAELFADCSHRTDDRRMTNLVDFFFGGTCGELASQVEASGGSP